MRLFLAVGIPDAVRSALTRLQDDLCGRLQGWRWVRPESIHLTLRFLGEVDPKTDAGSRHAFRAAAAAVRPFELRLGRFGRFPERGAPRILWVGMDEVGGGGCLRELAERVEQSARSAGFEPERRPFRPHLTLARARRGESPAWADGIAVDCSASVTVEELILFRSQLHPAGARYTAVDRFRLEGEDG